MSAHERITGLPSTEGRGILPKATSAFPETAIDALFGCLPYSGAGLSLKQMDAAVASEAKRRA